MLKDRFGMTGKALGWIQSYLSGTNQFVKIGTERSSSRNLFCGVPQGSVLGPILYSMYTSPLTDIISKHNMNHHFYADDSQIYLSFKPNAVGEPTTSKLRIESCLHDVNNWMSANKLMLNHDKTELLVLHARRRAQPPLESILICSDVLVYLGFADPCVFLFNFEWTLVTVFAYDNSGPIVFWSDADGTGSSSMG